jgi:hypothetical protein
MLPRNPFVALHHRIIGADARRFAGTPRGGPRRGSPIELLTSSATGAILKFEAPTAPMGMAVAMCTLSLLGVATDRMGEARGTAVASVQFASAVGVSYAL